MQTHKHTWECTHTHIHTNPRILSSCCQHFNVLMFKFEAPTGCLERLIQPVCLGAISFISLLVTSKNSVFLVGCVRVVECFGFWLQLVNFSESVDPGVSWEVFSQAQEVSQWALGSSSKFPAFCVWETANIREVVSEGKRRWWCLHPLSSLRHWDWEGLWKQDLVACLEYRAEKLVNG